MRCGKALRPRIYPPANRPEGGYPGGVLSVTAAYILGLSRAVGETMVVEIAAGQQAKIALNPLEGAATITAYIVQISLGDVPHGSIAYPIAHVGSRVARLHSGSPALRSPSENATRSEGR